MIKHAFIIPIAVALSIAGVAHAEKLVINSNESDPAPKQTFAKVVEEFKKQNPDLQVDFNTMDHEGYKTAIRNWLTTGPPDVVYWFAGNRMKAFVDRGLLDDVSDLWQKNNYDQVFKSTLPANQDAKPPADPFLEAGAELLAKSKTAQFYDRDTNPEMATEGMKGFQEFMAFPNRLDAILQRLDKIRERVFKEQAKEAGISALDKERRGEASPRLVEQAR